MWHKNKGDSKLNIKAKKDAQKFMQIRINWVIEIYQNKISKTEQGKSM